MEEVANDHPRTCFKCNDLYVFLWTLSNNACFATALIHVFFLNWIPVKRRDLTCSKIWIQIIYHFDNPWTAEIKASSAKLIVLWQKHKQSTYERVRRELFLGDCSVPVRLTSLSLVTAPNEFCNTIQNIRIVFIIFTYNTIIDDIKSSYTKRRSQSLLEKHPLPPDRMNIT